MGNACQPFGFDPNNGQKAFCAAEMFVSVFNMILGCQIGKLKALPLARLELRNGEDTTLLIFSTIITMSLNLQGILGFFLYYLTWKKKIINICWIWMGLALLTITVTSATLFIDPNAFYPIPTWCFIYLFYLVYGIMVNYSFVRWCKQAGVALHFALAPIHATVSGETDAFPGPNPDNPHLYSSSETKQIGQSDQNLPHLTDHQRRHRHHSPPKQGTHTHPDGPQIHVGSKRDHIPNIVGRDLSGINLSFTQHFSVQISGSRLDGLNHHQNHPAPVQHGQVNDAKNVKAIEPPSADDSVDSLYQNDNFR